LALQSQGHSLFRFFNDDEPLGFNAEHSYSASWRAVPPMRTFPSMSGPGRAGPFSAYTRRALKRLSGAESVDKT